MIATIPMIAFERVAKAFAGVRAVDGVSLAVARGELLAIVGGSGSGKTTLLRLANRLIEPDAGTIRIDGADIRDGDAVALRRRIGTVFQSGALFPHLSVAANIGITPKLLGWNAAARSPRGSTNCWRWCGSTPPHIARACRMNCPAASASASRVARALAAKPEIVLMDEPFGALDPLTRDALGEDFRALHDDLGVTTMMITHDITEALLLADRIAVMRDGRILAQGTAAELATQRRRLRHRVAAGAAPAGAPAGDAAAAGRAGMTLFADPRWSEALAHLPDYLGSHLRVSIAALALGLAVSLPLAILCARPAAAGAAPCSASPASCRPFPGWRCWRCSIRCCWRWRR